MLRQAREPRAALGIVAVQVVDRLNARRQMPEDRLRDLGRDGLLVLAVTDKDVATPLHIAARTGQERMCRLLVLRGAAPDAVAAGGDGATPLHEALTDGCRLDDDLAGLLEEGVWSRQSMARHSLAAARKIGRAHV